MRKTIDISLSEASINNAIQELDAFNEWIQAKTKALNDRLALIGQQRAEVGFNANNLYDGDDREVTVTAVPDGDGWLIIANGHAVAFIEYGAGIYFNGPEPYPTSGEIVRPPEVARIGEYGSGRGKQNVWVFVDSTGKKHWTHGTPADMPMFYATETIRNEIAAIAQEVFA